MQNQKQETVTRPTKARRKSETLTLSPEATWLLAQVVARTEAEELTFYQEGPARERHRCDTRGRPRLRRLSALRALELGLEAILELPSVFHARSWWKLKVEMMSEEEMAARDVIRAATLSPREGVIDDAKEAAGIALIESGKEALPWNGA
jgi:hypothetical protein